MEHFVRVPINNCSHKQIVDIISWSLDSQRWLVIRRVVLVLVVVMLVGAFIGAGGSLVSLVGVVIDALLKGVLLK